tara:strand:+ start:340 stop:591 length:252 start_codon:yes stop_codon:yes gene_type:complete
MSIDLATKEEWDSILVNKPPHYNQGGMEAIDYIKQQLGEGIVDYCEGNVLKYLHRWRYKNGLQDLQKAQWYLNKMVEEQAGAK